MILTHKIEICFFGLWIQCQGFPSLYNPAGNLDEVFYNQLFKHTATNHFGKHNAPIPPCNPLVLIRITNMQFPTTLSSVFVLAIAVTSTSAAPQTVKRQGPSGDTIFALQTFFGARGCTGPGDLEPTFAGVNLCQPIRSIQPSVESIILGAVTPNFHNCEGKKSSPSPSPYLGYKSEIQI
jgi:hypothetical protein